MSPCNCGSRRSNRYVVVDGSNDCLIRKPGGDCKTFPNVTAANRAAVSEGLSDYWVQPR